VSTDILPFQNDDTQIRALNIEGEPWFIAGDICEALGLTNVGQALGSLDEDEKSSIIISDGTPGNPNRAIISESGLYSLILRSRKPEAKAFKRWITRDVIPTIRRTGSYSVTPQLTGPALYLAAIEQATAEIHALETRNAELEPKAARFDDYLGAKGDYSFTSAAKVLQRDHQITLGGRKLIGLLTAWGWIYRSGKRGSIMPYQAQIDTKRLALRATTYMDQSTGEMVAGDPQTRVTPKGVHDIAERLTRTALAA
jgi:prophage antirepressor-like protein